MKKTIFTDKDFTLWWRLFQTRRVLLKARNKELNVYGITNSHAAVLFVIKVVSATEAEVTPGKIAKWMLREPHTISALLDRMEREGLVKKAKDMEKRNLIRISMTEKGRRVYLASTKRESIRTVVSCLSEEQRGQLRTCLKLMRETALKELGD